tara:strand:- start:6699 stop:6845 length:147 start_codon:yes stop_codon:yes gene_type:complete
MNGKGSGRRQENTTKVIDKLSTVSWNKRDKRQDKFKVTINGKVATNAK